MLGTGSTVSLKDKGIAGHLAGTRNDVAVAEPLVLDPWRQSLANSPESTSRSEGFLHLLRLII
jgi:hypothetical protein